MATFSGSTKRVSIHRLLEERVTGWLGRATEAPIVARPRASKNFAEKHL